MKRLWQVLNILSVAFALVMNYLVGAQVLNVPSINEISDNYATFLTPATYAFSIWILIYLLIILLALYQARDFFIPVPANTLPQKLGPYFILANIGNGIWTYVFVQNFIGLSVIILLIIVAMLFLVLKRLGIAMYQPSFKTLLFVWWPLMLYTGWVLVASVVNIASWLASLHIMLGQFTVLAILILLCNVLLVLLYIRNMRELVAASTWGIIAIGVESFQSKAPLIVTASAITVSSILFIAIGVHAYIYRRTNALRYLSH